MRTISALVALQVAVILVGLGVVQHAGFNGQVKGCQAAVEMLVPPDVSPKCEMKKARLVLTLTHPVLKLSKSYDVISGEEVQ